MIDLIDYLKREKIEYHEEQSIRSYLTIEVGGSVPLLAVVYSDTHLKKLLIEVHRTGRRFILLGGGSNVVFPDRFSDPDLIVIVNRTSEIVKESEGMIKVNSGVMNRDLMEWNVGNNIGGMDFLSGVPGTIGGAAAVNAGAFGNSISNILEKAEILDKNGQIKMVDNSYFQFVYRNSIFKYGNEVIVNIFMSYVYEDSGSIREKVDSRVNYRIEKHPGSDNRSAGCFFKNPVIDGKKTSAGQLIEQSGFKGTTYENLRLDESHSNFVINRGDASFSDVKELETEIVREVSKKKGVTLEREVIYISPEGEKY
ncbi:MAG: UDP-N-acetylmuramate dehydrogenase [bacterium]|nr:UDP-N-acetylmuramate dehydrogenase [bacterium]